MSKGWMPLYIGDYIADTKHLTTVQHGAYLLLIMHYWQHGGLPTDHASLKRIAGLPFRDGENQWRSICPAIAPFFDANWRHARIEKELAKAEKIKTLRQVAGAKGGAANRGRNNWQRTDHATDKAFAKQRDDQSHKSITSTLVTAAARASPATASAAGEESKGTSEMEHAAPSRPDQTSRASLEAIYASKRGGQC